MANVPHTMSIVPKESSQQTKHGQACDNFLVSTHISSPFFLLSYPRCFFLTSVKSAACKQYKGMTAMTALVDVSCEARARVPAFQIQITTASTLRGDCDSALRDITYFGQSSKIRKIIYRSPSTLHCLILVSSMLLFFLACVATLCGNLLCFRCSKGFRGSEG